MASLKSVCVYCGANRGSGPEYAAAAQRLGALLAERGITVIYGGGSVGLMGVLADAVLAGGGKVIGVIPKGLFAREVAHRGVTKMHVVRSMHERKALMADLADAFIAMPGGLGTLDETFEMLSWAQLGLHAKPCGMLNVGGYFDDLHAFLDHSVERGFLRSKHRRLLIADTDARRLLRRLARYAAPAASRRGER
jgi:hypothetical protein